MADTWYSPQQVKAYKSYHVKWLIPLLPLLRTGVYPPDPTETGYDESRVSGKGGVPKTPFMRAITVATELDMRLERAGIAGMILELKYTNDNQDDIYLNQHIANMLSIPVWRVMNLSTQGMAYVTGKHQKSRSFREFIYHRRTGSMNIARD